MNRILDRLWLGAVKDIERAPLASLGFRAVLVLCDGAPALEPGIELLVIGNRDGDAWAAELVQEAFDFITTYIREGRVLVVCAAGMSRSASIVIGYLVRHGWDRLAAFNHVKRARPEIAPVPAMLEAALHVALAT